MTKKDIVKVLILSPCYLQMRLRDRARLIRRLILQQAEGITEEV